MITFVYNSEHMYVPIHIYIYKILCFSKRKSYFEAQKNQKVSYGT